MVDVTDYIYIETSGLLLAENMTLDFWTDAAGKRHVVAENLLAATKAADFDPEKARASRDLIPVRLVRGSTGDVIRFIGLVSRAGMRSAAGEPLRVTFQIDET